MKPEQTMEQILTEAGYQRLGGNNTYTLDQAGEVILREKIPLRPFEIHMRGLDRIKDVDTLDLNKTKFEVYIRYKDE